MPTFRAAWSPVEKIDSLVKSVLDGDAPQSPRIDPSADHPCGSTCRSHHMSIAACSTRVHWSAWKGVL